MGWGWGRRREKSANLREGLVTNVCRWSNWARGATKRGNRRAMRCDASRQPVDTSNCFNFAQSSGALRPHPPPPPPPTALGGPQPPCFARATPHVVFALTGGFCCSSVQRPTNVVASSEKMVEKENFHRSARNVGSCWR